VEGWTASGVDGTSTDGMSERDFAVSRASMEDYTAGWVSVEADEEMELPLP
jgi:hypothetical protein